MAVFFKAIMGVRTSFVDKYTKMTTPSMNDKRIHDLERLLLRVSIIIEEAEGRDITNQAIVHQLNLLRKEMYSGYFIMDNLRSQGFDVKDHVVSHSFALSKFNPVKHTFFTSIRTHGENDLEKVLDNLSNIIEDMTGLIMFLKNYPPLYKQPYSMHLFIGKCMFGRQMEMERIMEFLLKKGHPATESVGVLPIVGPKFVGKSTIIAHVCNDARVRNYFSQVKIFTVDNINKENLYSMKDWAVTMHQTNGLGENERVLVVIELSGDIDEVVWDSLCSSYGCYLGDGSRIIITSRSNQVKKIGTTSALVLNYLQPEAYWYFFKVLTFGSAYSSDHSELESIAMEISRGLSGSFISAYLTSRTLQKSFVPQHWRMYLAYFKKNIQENISRFGQSPYHLMRESKPFAYQLHNSDQLAVFNKHHACRDAKTIPRITLKDVICGNIKHEGVFETLIWKSVIAPYKSYIVSCKIEKLNQNNKMKVN